MEHGSLRRVVEEVEERALKSNSCPKSDRYEEYYNALFELDDKDGACRDCLDEDYFSIGELIQDITEAVDQDFPDSPYSEDVIDINTEVCESNALYLGRCPDRAPSSKACNKKVHLQVRWYLP